MSVYQPSSLTALLQQEALEKLERMERDIAREAFAALDAIPVARHDTLAPKEFQVLLGMIRGERVSVMAERMKVVPQTIAAHQQHIRDKLGIRHNRDLVRYAFKIAFERGRG